MLWRPAYRTLVAKDFVVPELRSSGVDPIPRFQVLIGGFDFLAYREMGIWKRLLTSESIPPEWLQVFFLDDPSPNNVKLLDSLAPPSERKRTLCLADGGHAWRDLVAPDRPEQSFAAVLQGPHALIMMKGIPTEEAWDAFQAEFSAVA